MRQLVSCHFLRLHETGKTLLVSVVQEGMIWGSQLAWATSERLLFRWTCYLFQQASGPRRPTGVWVWAGLQDSVSSLLPNPSTGLAFLRFGKVCIVQVAHIQDAKSNKKAETGTVKTCFRVTAGGHG